MINTPPKYQSYANLHNQIPEYQGFLTDIDRELVKKKPIKHEEGLPRIGTFRINTSNFEKRSLT